MIEEYKSKANDGVKIVELLNKVEQRGRKKIAFGWNSNLKFYFL